ncbi:MAG: hypothetical protein J7L32_04760 [Thermoplasmata archaeon]|nr:hypothetical protein [Thermoplasmata archaeon]
MIADTGETNKMDKQQNKNIIKKLVNTWGREAIILRYAYRWQYIETSDSRASAVVMYNPDIKNSSEKTILFGFIRFPKDIDIVRKLFQSVEEEAKKMKGTQIIGPLNYSTWFSYRWTTQNLDKNIKAWPEPKNPRYMPETAKKIGFSECIRYFSSMIKAGKGNESYERTYKKTISKGYNFKRYRKKISQYLILRTLYDIAKEAFTEKPLYSPISYKIFKRIYLNAFKKLNSTVDLCLYKNKPVGFSFSYENPYGKNILIWKTVALKKEFQGKGIGSAFRYLTHQYAVEENKSSVIQLLMHTESKSKNLITDGRVIREYALFCKKLE